MIIKTSRHRQDQKNAAWKRWYSNPDNKRKFNRAAADRKSVKRKELKVWVKSLLRGKKCSVCGFSNTPALQYHHRDSEKKLFNISSAYVTLRTKKCILDEINKCDILCANCHFILHDNERRK